MVTSPVGNPVIQLVEKVLRRLDRGERVDSQAEGPDRRRFGSSLPDHSGVELPTKRELNGWQFGSSLTVLTMSSCSKRSSWYASCQPGTAR